MLKKNLYETESDSVRHKQAALTAVDIDAVLTAQFGVA